MISVNPDLRVQLEGKVEALERELNDLSEAITAAKARHFQTLEELLAREPLTLRTHDDPGLLARLDERSRLRRQLEQLLSTRARKLGMPSATPARVAHWLAIEPVHYEHHRISRRFLLLLPFAITHALLLPSMAGLVVPPLVLLGPLVFGLLVHHLAWTDVVLTAQRLVLEDQVFPVEGLLHVAVARWRVELEYASGAREQLRVREFPTALIEALQRRGVAVVARAI
jgi:hypothetical protein